MVPEWRPSRPLSTGPTLFFAPSPTAWHARHFLNDCSPAATSCAATAPVDAATMITAIAIVFIITLSIPTDDSDGLPSVPAGFLLAISNGGMGAPCQRSRG